MSDQKNKTVSLPGLRTLIDEISKDRNLPVTAVQLALREALLKGYERYRRAQHLDKMHFEEEFFDTFDVQLDMEEESFQVIATKVIVEEVMDPDHEISIEEVKKLLGIEDDSAELPPEARIGGHPGQTGIGAKTPRSAAQNSPRRI
jgi:transcription termination/antitermination protein NusA